MVETKKAVTNTTTQPPKKSFLQTMFKSREFITDVYLRFDCILYLILGGFGIYNPTGMANLLNYTPFDINGTTSIIEPTTTTTSTTTSSEELYSTYNNDMDTDKSFEFDSTTLSTSPSFIPLYENPLILGIATMYTFLLSLIAIFQCIISFMALIQNEKPTKSILVNLSLTLNFFLILFNTYVIFVLPHVFTRFANMGKIVSYGISILDFLALFFLTGKHRSLISVITSIFKFLMKIKLPRKLPNLNSNNNSTNKKKK